MQAYLDSGIIVKLYVQEATSPAAIQLVSGYSIPCPLSMWQALEVRNAIRLKAFRGEITRAEMTKSLLAFQQDIEAGRWEPLTPNTADIMAKAESLSANYASSSGCRTLDIIHVAACLVLGAVDFVTFDQRQAALATSAGLAVKR